MNCLKVVFASIQMSALLSCLMHSGTGKNNIQKDCIFFTPVLICFLSLNLLIKPIIPICWADLPHITPSLQNLASLNLLLLHKIGPFYKYVNHWLCFIWIRGFNIALCCFRLLWQLCPFYQQKIVLHQNKNC